MRFFTAVLSVLSIAAATVTAQDYDFDTMDTDYDYDTAAAPIRTRTDTSFVSSPLGMTDFATGLGSYHQRGDIGSSGWSQQDVMMIMKALEKFDRLGVKADRVGSYEVNPSFVFDNARSLNLKMTPIVNYQKRNFYSIPTTGSEGNKIMTQLLSLGIKPMTVKKYLYLKKQGFTNPTIHNPVNVMLRLQRQADLGESHTAFITAPTLSSSWSINQPLTADPYVTGFSGVAPPPMAMESMMNPQHGVVIPSLQLATSLRDSGVIVSTTITGHPAIEIKHLQDSLFQCEKLEWKTAACVKLHQFAMNVLKEPATTTVLPHSSIVGLTSPTTMSNIQLENLVQESIVQ